MSESAAAMLENNQDIRDTATANKYYDQGLKAEEAGDRLGAIEAYEAAYTADPDNPEVSFRLAYNLDLVGEEDEALHLYEQCVQAEHPPLNALMNLAVLYEDAGEYVRAEKCLRQVLDTNPNHVRARLFMKDVQASREMFVDEEQDRAPLVDAVDVELVDLQAAGLTDELLVADPVHGLRHGDHRPFSRRMARSEPKTSPCWRRSTTAWTS